MTHLANKKYDSYHPTDGLGPIYRRVQGRVREGPELGVKAGTGYDLNYGQGRDWVGPELGARAGTRSGLSRMSEQGRTRGLSLRKGRAVTYKP